MDSFESFNWAGDSAQATNSLSLSKPDIVLLDLKLPNEREEKEYQTIIQSSFDGFWVCDMKGKLLEMNQAFCEIVGYSEEELLKMKISDFGVIENPENTANHFLKIIKNRY